MHVAHFETGAFARQAARPKGRHAPLVGDFRQRIGLVHELRQLRGAEEFAHRGRHRLGVDQIVRHDRVDIDRAHAFLDGALHAQQTDAELVLHQLADRAHAAVAEIVDVIDFAAAVAQFRQRFDDGQDVFLAQNAHRVLGIEAQAHIHLDAADAGQIVAFGIEEQLAEQSLGGVERRRLAGTHDAIDIDQRLFAGVVLVHRHGVADIGADGDAIDIDHVDLVEIRFRQMFEIGSGQLVARFHIDFAGSGLTMSSAE